MAGGAPDVHPHMKSLPRPNVSTGPPSLGASLGWMSTLAEPAPMLVPSHFFTEASYWPNKAPKMLDLNSQTLISKWNEIFVILGNNLDRFWDFYHGTNMGAGPPKV